MMNEITRLIYTRRGIMERIKEIRSRIQNCPYFELRKEADNLLRHLDWLEEIEGEIDKEEQKLSENS